MFNTELFISSFRSFQPIKQYRSEIKRKVTGVRTGTFLVLPFWMHLFKSTIGGSKNYKIKFCSCYFCFPQFQPIQRSDINKLPEVFIHLHSFTLVKKALFKAYIRPTKCFNGSERVSNTLFIRKESLICTFIHLLHHESLKINKRDKIPFCSDDSSFLLAKRIYFHLIG